MLTWLVSLHTHIRSSSFWSIHNFIFTTVFTSFVFFTRFFIYSLGRSLTWYPSQIAISIQEVLYVDQSFEQLSTYLMNGMDEQFNYEVSIV
jgi:hypothetical protein